MLFPSIWPKFDYIRVTSGYPYKVHKMQTVGVSFDFYFLEHLSILNVFSPNFGQKWIPTRFLQNLGMPLSIMISYTPPTPTPTPKKKLYSSMLNSR